MDGGQGRNKRVFCPCCGDFVTQQCRRDHMIKLRIKESSASDHNDQRMRRHELANAEEVRCTRAHALWQFFFYALWQSMHSVQVLVYMYN